MPSGAVSTKELNHAISQIRQHRVTNEKLHFGDKVPPLSRIF